MESLASTLVTEPPTLSRAWTAQRICLAVPVSARDSATIGRSRISVRCQTSDVMRPGPRLRGPESVPTVNRHACLLQGRAHARGGQARGSGTAELRRRTPNPGRASPTRHLLLNSTTTPAILVTPLASLLLLSDSLPDHVTFNIQYDRLLREALPGRSPRLPSPRAIQYT